MKSSRNTFKCYNYKDHSFLAVKLQTLFALNLQDQISSHSYMKGKTAYLEEDLDAGIFIKKWKEVYGEIHFDEKHTDKSSPIRSYDYFSKNKALMKFKE